MKCKKSKVFLLSLLSVVSLSLGGCKNSDSTDKKYQRFLKAQEAGYSGTYEEWLLSIKGEKGEDGKDGADGKDGTDGKDGKDGATWLTGSGKPDESKGNVGDFYLDTATFTLYQKEDKGWVSLGSIKGKDGEKGETGSKGEPGSKGDNGADGKDGQDGKDGADGKDGVGISSITSEYFYKDGKLCLKITYYLTNGEKVETVVEVPKKAIGAYLDTTEIAMIKEGEKKPDIYLNVHYEDTTHERIKLTDERIVDGKIDFTKEGYYNIKVSFSGYQEDFRIRVYDPDNVSVTNVYLHESNILFVKNDDGTYTYGRPNLRLSIVYDVSLYNETIDIDLSKLIDKDKLDKLSEGEQQIQLEYQGFQFTIAGYIVNSSALDSSICIWRIYHDSDSDITCFTGEEPLFVGHYLSLNYNGYYLEKEIDTSRINGFDSSHASERTPYPLTYLGMTTGVTIDIGVYDKSGWTLEYIYVRQQYFPLGTVKEDILVQCEYYQKTEGRRLRRKKRLSDLYSGEIDLSTKGQKEIKLALDGGGTVLVNFTIYDPENPEPMNIYSSTSYYDVNHYLECPIVIRFDDGHSEEATLGDLTDLQIDLTKLGETQRVKGKYKEKEIEFSLELYDPEVNKIRRISFSGSRSYGAKVGDSIESVISKITSADNKLYVEYYGKSASVSITKDRLDYSKVDMNKVGTYTIYIEFEGEKIDLDLIVSPSDEKLAQEHQEYTGFFMGREGTISLYKDETSKKPDLFSLLFNGASNAFYTEEVEEVNSGLSFRRYDTAYYVTVDTAKKAFESKYDFSANLGATRKKEYTLDATEMNGEDSTYTGSLKLFSDSEGNNYAYRKVTMTYQSQSMDRDLSWKYSEIKDGKLYYSGESYLALDDTNSTFTIQ